MVGEDNMDQEATPRRISRQAFLRSAVMAGGALATLPLLAACGVSTPAAAPTAASASQAPATAPTSVAPLTAVPAAPSTAAATTAAATGTTPPLQHAPVREQESDKPLRGGILPTSLGKDIENLLIMHYVNGPLRISTNFCYRRLVQIRANSRNDLEVAPDMADAWEILDGGKTYVFHLHPGIKWHNVPPVNGREFTSADVDWTITYYKTKDPEYGWLYDWVTSWETPDKYTVVLHADKPFAEALLNLAVDNNVLIAKEVFDRDGDYRKTVVGTGPFIWKNWQPGVKVEVRRNPDYWEISELDGKQLPYLDGIDMFVQSDYAARLAAFKSQRITGNLWGFQPNAQDVDPLKKALPHLREWEGFHLLGGDAAILNTTRPPWNDVRVRRAASMALDRDALLKGALGNAAWGQWEGFVGPGFEKYTWSQDKLRSMPYFKYDPDQARKLVTEAEVGDVPIPLNITDSSGPVRVQAEMMQQMWKAVGLNATLDQTDIPTSYQKRVTGDFSVFPGGVGFTSGSIDASTRQLYHSKGSRNYGKVSDPVVDDLTTQQLGELDVDKRVAIVDKIQQQLYDQMWAIPTYVGRTYDLNQAWCMNKAWCWQLAWAYPERIWMDMSHNSA
jgi:peptide/nickel transport system substrate-binding protein